jgi:hypothetical protein
MSAYFWLRSAAVLRRSIRYRYRLPVILAALALLIQGCTGRPPPLARGPDASDPEVRVPAASYRSAIGAFARQRPVEPAPWRERNDSVAPTPKPDGK